MRVCLCRYTEALREEPESAVLYGWVQMHLCCQSFLVALLKNPASCYSAELVNFVLSNYVACSNRAIAHLHMGLHAKALADAEDAILLDPEYSKGPFLTWHNSLHLLCWASFFLWQLVNGKKKFGLSEIECLCHFFLQLMPGRGWHC